MSTNSKLSALGVACCLLACSACGDTGVRTDTGAKPFERAGWHSGDGTTRFEMATSLIASGELIGLTKKEINDKLGFPSKEYGQMFGPASYCTDWPIGERTRFPANDKIIFTASFDKNDVCIEVQIRYPD